MACSAKKWPMAALSPVNRGIPGTATMYFQTGPRFTINVNAILTTMPYPLRRFQSLRYFKEALQLPRGYFGMFPIA